MGLPIYEINSLKHVYSGRSALQIEHLDIQPASIVGLIGPNGSGKSTLLKLLGLIKKPTAGEIRFNGRRVEPFSEKARFQITLLPQEPFLMKRNVFNNISYGLKLRGNGGDFSEKINDALSLVGLSGGDFIRRPWYALSGGETQRVALAARLALNPKILLLDEPTASVDAASAQLIKEASLRARQEMGTTLIVASHDWQWLFEICDEILHLFKGKIIGTGRETIIFGPWQNIGTGRWSKNLSDKQQLFVPEPPNPDAAAVIDIPAISNAPPPADTKDLVVLQGLLSRLRLERKTGQLYATCLVGDQPFTVKLPMEQQLTDACYPGNTIYIHYRIEHVKWV